MIHAKVYGAALAFLLLLFGAILVDSRIRGHSTTRLDDLRAISSVIPSADPGMDNSARYIRHLGLSTPGSAFPDYPGQPDYLPSGMMWPPPPFVGLASPLPLSEPAGLRNEGAGR